MVIATFVSSGIIIASIKIEIGDIHCLLNGLKKTLVMTMETKHAHNETGKNRNVLVGW